MNPVTFRARSPLIPANAHLLLLSPISPYLLNVGIHLISYLISPSRVNPGSELKHTTKLTFLPSSSPGSEMGIAQSLLSAWSSAVEPNSTTRFLKISIQDEQAVLSLSVAQRSSNSAKDDFALVEEKGEISPTEPCYILYKLDKGKGWCFITYVSLC